MMNRSLLEETVRVGLDVSSSGFNMLHRLTGDGGCNLQYIGRETGVLVSLRGRGSSVLDPSTRRESTEPLHILLEHDSSKQALELARKLVLDLIESVRDDWKAFQKHLLQSRGGESRRDSCNDGRQPKQGDRSSSGGGSRYDCNKEDLRQSREEYDYGIGSGGPQYRNQYDDPWKDKGWNHRSEGSYEVERESERWDGQRSGENVRSKEDFHHSSGPRNHREDMQVGGNNRDLEFQQSQERKRDWNRSQVRGEQQDRSGLEWRNEQNQGSKKGNGQHWSYHHGESDSLNEGRSMKRKSRWDSAGSNKKSVVDKSVMGMVLDQKKKIEERLERVSVFKMMQPLGSASLSQSDFIGLPAEMNINPLLLSQEKLMHLNHKELLEVSKKQQALLLQLAANVSRSNTGLPSNQNQMQNWQENVILQSNQRTADMQKGQERMILHHDDNYMSDDEVSPYRNYSTPCRDELGRERERDNMSPSYGGKKWTVNEQSTPYHTSSGSYRGSWDPPLNRSSLSPRAGRSHGEHYSPSQEMYSRDQDRYSPPGRGAERYSPQLSSGQERYSPQLEDYPSRSNQTQRLSQYRPDKMWEKVLGCENEKRLKDMIGFGVAVIDRNYNQMGIFEGDEIKGLVCKELLQMNNPHRMDFEGLIFHDYVYVLMPHTLEGKRWLVDMASLTSQRGNKYIMFPLEDFENRYRMKALLYHDMLDGYRPSEAEVMMELGRLNESLNVDQWEVFKFHREKKGYFMLLSIDTLSYLQLSKTGWKANYRISFIRIEPIMGDKATDKHFL